MRTIRDVMREEVDVLCTTDTVADAARFLALNDDPAPLCQNDGCLAGTISSRDIVARVVAEGRNPRQVTLAEFARPADVLALDIGAPSKRPSPSCAAISARASWCWTTLGRRLRHPARPRPFHQLPGALGRQLTGWTGGRQPCPAASAAADAAAFASATAFAMVSARAAASSSVTTRRP